MGVTCSIRQVAGTTVCRVELACILDASIITTVATQQILSYYERNTGYTAYACYVKSDSLVVSKAAQDAAAYIHSKVELREVAAQHLLV